MSLHHSIKSLLITCLKLGIAGALIVWLVNSDKLHLSELRILIEDPRILMITISTWVIGPLLLGALRWLLLLRGSGYEVSFPRAVSLQLIGFFFNTAMPGAVGGDLIKVIYVIRDNKGHGKTPAMMSIILDRILGIFALFTIAFGVILFNLKEIMQSPVLKPFAFMIFGIMLLSICLFGSVFIKYKDDNDPFLRFFNRRFGPLRFLKIVYSAFRRYHHSSKYLLAGWAISVLIQLVMFFYFATLTKAMLVEDVSTAGLAIIFPIGILTTALPVAPGGLGVGHVAFDSLFHMIGASGGANVFNVYFLNGLVLSLLGAIPYLALKRQPSLKESPVI